AIESGAFWFYRKLGFRPGRADLQRLAEREEGKIAAATKLGRTNDRTPARTLRRLAAGHAFYESPGSEVGAWDSFSARNVGLRVNRRMAREFQGDSDRMRKESVRSVARMLGADPSSWPSSERASFENLALVLALVPGLTAWKREEKEALARIIRSKSKADEMSYLHLTQRHERFREALLKIGSLHE